MTEQAILDAVQEIFRDYRKCLFVLRGFDMIRHGSAASVQQIGFLRQRNGPSRFQRFGNVDSVAHA